MSKNNFSEEQKKLFNLYHEQTGKKAVLFGKISKQFIEWNEDTEVEEAIEIVKAEEEVENKEVLYCQICGDLLIGKQRKFCSKVECLKESRKIRREKRNAKKAEI